MVYGLSPYVITSPSSSADPSCSPIRKRQACRNLQPWNVSSLILGFPTGSMRILVTVTGRQTYPKTKTYLDLGAMIWLKAEFHPTHMNCTSPLVFADVIVRGRIWHRAWRKARRTMGPGAQEGRVPILPLPGLTWNLNITLLKRKKFSTSPLWKWSVSGPNNILSAHHYPMSQHIPIAYPLELNILSACPPLLHVSQIEWVLDSMTMNNVDLVWAFWCHNTSTPLRPQILSGFKGRQGHWIEPRIGEWCANQHELVDGFDAFDMLQATSMISLW